MSTICKINAEHPETELIESAQRILASGGLVVVPTETVYGITCDPSVPGALEKLIAAKGRNINKPIARLAASPEQVKADATNWSPALQALADTFWPGPLTIVLETADGFTGYRVPNHAVPLKLAETCGHPLALTSANRSGDPDPHTAIDAARHLATDLVLDSGPTSAAIPSTVVKAAGNTIKCLREGVLPFPDVKNVFKQATSKKRKILFVCTGNTCRSPMAAALFNTRIGKNANWKAASAGIFAGKGIPASRNAVEAMRELQIDISDHKSKPVTADLLKSVDMIVTMTGSLKADIVRNYPDVAHKVFLIKSFGITKVPTDICDPFSGSLNDYRIIRDEIDQAITDLILYIHEQKNDKNRGML